MSRSLSRLAFAFVALTIISAQSIASAADTDDPRPLDPKLLQQKGIRTLSGKHLTLHTDLPASPAVDELPKVFDLAFDAWCQYFGIDQAAHADWRAIGFLIKDKDRFAAADLLPKELTSFHHGHSLGRQFWMFDQPSDYFRRHLLLHEGTHAFMETVVGGIGPPWYQEGMAELLATHRWQDGRLTLDVFPDEPGPFRYWGRIELLEDQVASHPLTFDELIAVPPFGNAAPTYYAWSWGAAAFLDGHPRYRERFRKLSPHVPAAKFNAEVRRAFADDSTALEAEWRLFVAEVDYGYDFARAALSFKKSAALPAGGAKVSVAADRAWQASGYRVEAGKTYRIRASGRYQVGQKPKPWSCEPSGVSIHYYRGRPLGQLLAAVFSAKEPSSGAFSPLEPIAIGLGATLTPRESGPLYFKINESPGKLADNRGTLEVEIVAE